MLHSESFTDYEVIFVDDFSSDDSFAIMNNLVKRYDNFKVYRTKMNGGPGPARNLGVSHATGEYILFCDSDDWFDIKCLHSINEFICKQDKTDLIIFPHQVVRKEKIRTIDLYEEYDNFSLIEKKDVIIGNVAPWAKLYKRENIIANNILFPSMMTGEDTCFVVQYVVCSEVIYKMNEVFYSYVMNENSITHRKDIKIPEKTTFEVLQPIYNEFFPEIEIMQFINTHLLTKAKQMYDAGFSCKSMKKWFSKENQKYPQWIKRIPLKEQSVYRKLIYLFMYYNMPVFIKGIMFIRRVFL